MSRDGYIDSDNEWEILRWRGQVLGAIRGQRGQAFLKDLIAALDALPTKRLIAEDLVAPGGGEFCALGAVCQARGISPWSIDPDDYDGLSVSLNIPAPLAREVMFENDEWSATSPEDRWQHMRSWAVHNLKRDMP